MEGRKERNMKEEVRNEEKTRKRRMKERKKNPNSEKVKKLP